MTSVAIPNKATALALDRKVIAGVDKYFANVTKLTLAGIDFTPATLKAVFQTDIDAQDAVDKVRAQAKELSASQRDARKAMRAARKALRAYLLGNYGDRAATMLDDFGLATPKKTSVKTETKAKAIVQSRATRKARGTKGKNQRKPIKGVVADPATSTSASQK